MAEAFGGEQCVWPTMLSVLNAINESKIGNRRGEVAALGSLGIAYADIGETRCAIQFYEQTLFIHRELGNRRYEDTALWYMSLALDQLSERAEAIQSRNFTTCFAQSSRGKNNSTLNARGSLSW